MMDFVDMQLDQGTDPELLLWALRGGIQMIKETNPDLPLYEHALDHYGQVEVE